MKKENFYPKLSIKGKQPEIPIIQAGMGVGVSLSPLASAIANEGGIGIISSAGIDRLVSKRIGRQVDTYHAIILEIIDAKNKSPKGLIGVNIMVALQQDYEASVRGAIDAGADFIISGAGMPLTLPKIQRSNNTAFMPIVSSARALNIICQKWEQVGFRPDAVVLEGPLAGGHLGFKLAEIDDPNHSLENLFPRVKETAMAHGDFPVIVAGGIYDTDDIKKFIKLGADGFQIGTRFLATEESSATLEYKVAVVNVKAEDIIVATCPGSPCGLPFRTIKQSPMNQMILRGDELPPCNKGYALQKDTFGKFTKCLAKIDRKNYFCICNGLLASAGYHSRQQESLYTVGTNAYKVQEITTVKKIMDEYKEMTLEE